MSSSNPCNCRDGDITRETRLRMAVLLQVKVRRHVLELQPRLVACSVRDTQWHCSSSMLLVALCLCLYIYRLPSAAVHHRL